MLDSATHPNETTTPPPTLVQRSSICAQGLRIMEGEGGSVSRGMSKSHNFSLYKLKLCVKKRRKNHPGRLVLDGLGVGAWRRRPGHTPWVPLRFGPRTCFADALSVRSLTKRSDDRITQGSVQIVLIFRLLLKITVDWPFHAISKFL